jgi:putative Ca2+/H+ antiporter (TMEM165/GDT1 family)
MPPRSAGALPWIGAGLGLLRNPTEFFRRTRERLGDTLEKEHSDMDWKLVATTFGAVFIAELGDKTQLATLTFASAGSSRWAVFLGSACALVASSAIAVLAGEAVARVVPPIVLQRAAAVFFVVIGLWVFWSSVE